MTRTSVLELTKSLISCKSITPDDAGCQKIIAGLLADAGFTTRALPFDDVMNLWAYHKASIQKPMLVFAGHTDVVPPGDINAWWHKPFSPVVEDGMLFGRGTSDMKGGLSAMLIAALNFIAAYPNYAGNIGFLITSDEEGSAEHGTKAVMQQLVDEGVLIDAVVIGEPSSSLRVGDTVRHGRRGSVTFTLTIEGIQGHVAYPQLARNPIHDAGKLIDTLSTYTWDEGTDDFPPSSLQVVSVQAGGQATNVIPASVKIVCNIRFSPMQTVDSLVAGIERIIANLRAADGTCLREYVTLDYSVSGLPFFTSQDTPIARATHDAVLAVCGASPVFSTGGGTSDGRFIAPYGIDVVELGVSNATAHKVNEAVACDDLHTLVQVYQVIAERFFAVAR